MWAAIVAGAIFAGVEPSAAASLSPVGKWNIAYNEGDCTLSRPFGDTARPTTLAIRPSVTMEAGELLLLSSSSDKRVHRGQGKLVLFPSGANFSTDWATAPLGKDRIGTRVLVDFPFWTALAAADRMEFRPDRMPPVALSVGRMAGPTRALTACGLDLLRKWGVDPALLVHVPLTEIVKLFNVDQYPPAAVRAGEQGTVGALSTVDRNGKVLRCRVVNSSGSRILDETTCSILIRRDSIAPPSEAGVAERFVYVPIRWLIPHK